MTSCTFLSDRMPAVARGVAQWSPADRAHLQTCPDCAAEWDLVRGAASLGDDLANSLDAPRVAERVVAALRVPAPRPSALRHLRWAVPLALAASLLLMLGRGRSAAGPDGGPDAPAVPLLPEAEQLTDAELETVLRLMPTADAGDVGGTEDLNDDELTQMLKDLEG